MAKLGIKRAKYRSFGKEEKQWKYVVFSIVRVLTCMVTILTFGFFNADWDTKLLFSTWMDAHDIRN